MMYDDDYYRMEQELENFNRGWDSFEFYGDLEFDEISEPRTILQFMNNQDYTLNSPMITDQINSFKKYLILGEKEELYYTRSWDSRKEILLKLQMDWAMLRDTKDFHKVCSELWKTEDVDVVEIRKLIKSVDNHARDTHVILESYLRAWLNSNLEFHSRINMNKDTLKFGAYMLDATIATWILNASSRYEIDQLVEKFKLTLIDPKDSVKGILYKSKLFGDMYIVEGVIYMKKHKMLWDRNMLLMFKDTSTARFQTLMAIQHRQFFPYSIDHYNVMTRMYKLGDDVLEVNPDNAYDVYGLIEPIASLQLSRAARAYRPYIDEFTHFTDHVNQKIAEMSEINPVANHFLNFILSQNEKYILLSIFGSFRHWGHPFINYLEGLEALYRNVTSRQLDIDPAFANQLASDLAYKILHKEFLDKKKWFVSLEGVPETDIRYKHIKNNTWPSKGEMQNIPDNWHTLPLERCWDVPEVVDINAIYSDKTHSLKRSAVLDWIKTYPNKPVPTEKVLTTLIKTPSTNWPEFLQHVNDHGLDPDDYVIGLKPKEREIKRKGRFFALMSWKLREYFVFTEYMIKKNVIPLFHGLTMADDQTTLIKKMISNSTGQGRDDYDIITFANHIDYEKWNNFQRKDSTTPVFDVIGQFYGYPNLFSRTHEFFEKSLIYYRDRPDLMKVVGDTLENKYEDTRVCWNGQLGGLEGLRQKGWSVLNLLVIERASRSTNADVKILAQGDNQVICVTFKLNRHANEAEIRKHAKECQVENNKLMRIIRDSTRSIGLKINENETLQSGDMLMYGKVIIFRGNITCLEEKRFSRITCTTNDQLPGLANVMSTVATNCLTVAHYSKSPLNAMVHYNWLGNFVISLLELHNPALRCAPEVVLKDPNCMKSNNMRIGLIYLDPSLGGVSGMSLTRFHIRMFPDPISEGLTFWKMVIDHSHKREIQDLGRSFGNPVLCRYNSSHFPKLLEDPTSINIPKGLSAQNLIKGEIKSAFQRTPDDIINEILKDAVMFSACWEKEFLTFLEGIRPCFPRFISEFRGASYFGLTDSVIGLFQNSRTIRKLFEGRFRKIVDTCIIECEKSSLEYLSRSSKSRHGIGWTCSASQADTLRLLSWGTKIVGMTVPHPAEMIKYTKRNLGICDPCHAPLPTSVHLVAIVSEGIVDPENHRGIYSPYLGSSTSENTSLVQVWEKATDVPFIRRAVHMRRSIGWFVDYNDPLAASMNGNIQSLTGEDPGRTKNAGARTGSALHRFSCSRVSPGGYIASAYTYSSRMVVSTDKFTVLGDQNYDFLFQAVLLYAQQTIGEIHGESPISQTYHVHIKCLGCLRTIEEPKLTSPREFHFPSKSENLAKWKPAGVDWLKKMEQIAIPPGNFAQLSPGEQSHEIGILHGVIYGDLHNNPSDNKIIDNLFPISIRDKLFGRNYFLGLMDGLYRAATLSAAFKRAYYYPTTKDFMVEAYYDQFSEDLSKHEPFIGFISANRLINELNATNHRVTASYPTSKTDMGSIFRNYMKRFRYKYWRDTCYSRIRPVWIFSDFEDASLSGLLILVHELAQIVPRGNRANFQSAVKQIVDLVTAVRTGTDLRAINVFAANARLYNQEVRAAMKSLVIPQIIENDPREDLHFEGNITGSLTEHHIIYTTNETSPPCFEVPKHNNPLISGLRLIQLATGSHYKLSVILDSIQKPRGAMLCGGDGSGGGSALLLRRYRQSDLIFNSLLKMTEVHLGGTLPSAPSAINIMPKQMRDRCVNLENSWEGGSNLAHDNTWESFKATKRGYDLKITLALFDMEVRDENEMNAIEAQFVKHLPHLMEKNGIVIIKSYVYRLLSKKSLLYTFGPLFHQVRVVQTSYTGSQSSEVYIIFSCFREPDQFRTYPVWSGLTEFLQSTYCFLTYEEEFTRALGIKSKNMTLGFPAMLKPSPLVELSGILHSIGMHPFVNSKLFYCIPALRDNVMSFALVTCLMISEQFINTVNWSKFESSIPSDQRLNNLFAYLIGTFLFFSIEINSPVLAKKLQRYIDGSFPVYIGQRSKRTMQGDIENVVYSGEWSMRPLRSTRVKKEVFVDSKVSLVASVIRYWRLETGSRQQSGLDEAALMMKNINSEYTWNHLARHTGLIQLMSIN